MVSVTLALTAILAGQWALAISLGPPRPTGDEVDYLQRSGHADPHQPELFLRVPLFIEYFVWSRKLTGRPEAVTWLVLSAGLAAALASVVAAHLAGLNALWVAVAFLLAPEALIFNRRYWPEPMLALACGVITVLLWQFPDSHGFFFGLVVAAAVMIRIEQLVLIPAVGVAWLWAGAEKGLWDWTGLVVPAVLCLGLWTLYCWRRYRIPWPDTTWQFNLALAHREVRQPLTAPVNVERMVQAEIKERLTAGATQASRRFTRWNPGFPRMPLRWLAMLGPETFISKRLLPPDGQGFPTAAWGELRRLWLRYGFTVLVCLTVCFGLLAGRFEPHLAPTLALFLAIASIHARTRYRAVLQSGLAIWLAEGMSGMDFGQSWVPWAGLLLAIMLAIGLGSMGLRVEE